MARHLKPYQASDGMKVEVKWSAKEKIKSGDQFTIDMPKRVSKRPYEYEFSFKKMLKEKQLVHVR